MLKTNYLTNGALIPLNCLSDYSEQDLKIIISENPNLKNRINGIRELKNYPGYLLKHEEALINFLNDDRNFDALIQFRRIISLIEDIDYLFSNVTNQRVIDFHNLWTNESNGIDYDFTFYDDREVMIKSMLSTLEKVSLPIFCYYFTERYDSEVEFQIAGIEKLANMSNTCKYFNNFWEIEDIYTWLLNLAKNTRNNWKVRAEAFIKLKYVKPEEFRKACYESIDEELKQYLLDYNDVQKKHMVIV